MSRWLRILLGPLPATVVLVPLILAGGLGMLFAMIGQLSSPSRIPGEPWATLGALGVLLLWIAAGVVGVLALWVVVLSDSLLGLRQAPRKWWLAGGLLVGFIAAGRWLLVMAGQGTNGTGTWLVWLGLLLGPMLLSLYYVWAVLVPRETES